LSNPDLHDSSVSQPSTPSEVALNGQLGGDTLYNTNVNVVLGPAAAVDVPAVNGFDLRPSVIPVWEGRSNRPSIDASVAALRQGPVISDEGGPIEIESMLGSIASLSRPSLQQDVAESAPVDDSEAGDPSLRLAAGLPAEGGAVSGELARAMAFELAGGEPAEAQRAVRVDRQEATSTPEGSRPTSSEPLSSAREEASDVNRVDSSAIPSPDEMVAGDTASTPGPVGEFASRLPRVVGHAMGPFVGPKLVVANVPMAMAPTTAAPLDRAREEAFEEFATEEVAAGSSLGLEFSLRGALNATPLLMVLALERIAASKSRRIKRHDAFVSEPRRPSRNSFRGGEHLV
jgi:hypothetical protein